MKFDLKTVNDVFFRAAGAGPERVMQWRDAAGKWQPITGHQLYARVHALATKLSEWGIGKGDRIAILSENRWEWAVADFAVLVLGAVDVPLYPTLTARQIAGMLADSGARIVFVSTVQQYEKVAALRDETAIKKIVIMNSVPDLTQAIAFVDLMPSDSEKTISERDPEFDRRAYDVQPDDLATIIYTSGTTGESKGVMLTHGNLAANLNVSTAAFHWGKHDSCISFLPLSHITARHVDYALLCHGAAVSYCPQFDLLPQAMKEVRPTIFIGVPRVYEKVRQEVLRRAGESSIRERLLHWALKRGRKQRETLLAGNVPDSSAWKLANKLVFRKIQQGFGGRVACFVSGGAPLGMDTAGWFLDAGILIQEGYGLTETSPVIAFNCTAPHRMGSVGKKLPNVETELAADGELLVRGPSIFKGYWRKPDATRDSFDNEGWFYTGDIARIDEDGFFFITDRKKDLLKTSGGKLIAPQPIENQLKADPLVAHAAMVGDRHKFACVLIAPNFAALEAFARGEGIESTDRHALIADPKVMAAYQQIIDRVNATLAGFETLKRFCLVSDEWAIESGEMTPSMKLKRRVVEQKYSAEIAAFYADEATSSR